ncbi:MAG TPA: hypothetical protein VEH82_03070, partial [Acidimicrobiales bacterium]|nr:hypothetical protein [Acidimicrobiales bacterium]
MKDKWEITGLPRREELLAASDAVIEDAVSYAEPMVLRGLLNQLTADEDVANTELTSVGGIDVPSIAAESDVALVRNRAATFLKGYRDAGAGPIDLG